MAYILATQIMSPLKAVGCSASTCSADTVNLNNFDGTDGPWRFTSYLLVLTAVAVASSLVFTPFLPGNKDQCRVWKAEGDASGSSWFRGCASLSVVVLIVVYGIVGSVLLLLPKTSCEAWIGGSGC